MAAQVKHGKAALDANTEIIEREYELKAQEALKVISESVAQASRPRIQDAELAQIWLDGLRGKELSEIDEFRFSSMMHESIWQGATMYGRLLALGRSDLAASEERVTATQINENPGYKKYWDRNRHDLTLWGLGELVRAVDAAREEKSESGEHKVQLP